MIAKNYGKVAHIRGLEIVQCDLEKHKKRVDLGGLIVDFVRKTVKGVDK